MDFINDIEQQKYAVLDDLYTLFSPSTLLQGYVLPTRKRHVLCGKFKQLERVIETTNQQWWDKFFLSKYIDTEISPRGLRVMKECTFLDNDNKREWADISAFCTSKWMTILISYRMSRFNKLKQDVHSLIQDIISHNTTIPLSWLDTLKKNTKTDEDSLLRMKLGKFRRELEDYNNDSVFTWKKSHFRTERPFPPLSCPYGFTFTFILSSTFPARPSTSPHEPLYRPTHPISQLEAQ